MPAISGVLDCFASGTSLRFPLKLQNSGALTRNRRPKGERHADDRQGDGAVWSSGLPPFACRENAGRARAEMRCAVLGILHAPPFTPHQKGNLHRRSAWVFIGISLYW
jgi:hypothetical protein